MARLLIKKELVEEQTQIDSAYIMTDAGSSVGVGSQEFMGFDTNKFLGQAAYTMRETCLGGEKDSSAQARVKIALAPAGSAILADVQT